MQSVTLQKCTPEDLPRLRQVALQSYQEHYMYLWTEERYAWWYMDISFGEESLVKQMNDPDSIFYFVVYQSEVVGFIKINKNKTPEGQHNSKSLELERIYLLKKVTGMGIGKKAVQMIINKAIEDQQETIWLKSMDSSKAVQFYEKLGFQIVKTEILPFEGFKDQYRGIHLMRREF